MNITTEQIYAIMEAVKLAEDAPYNIEVSFSSNSVRFGVWKKAPNAAFIADAFTTNADAAHHLAHAMRFLCEAHAGKLLSPENA